MKFDMGNPDRKYLCAVCGELHTKEELQKCRDNYNAIQKHNNNRQGKGLKFKDELFQFASHVAIKNCKDKRFKAYHDNKYDKIFIELNSFQKPDGSMDLEALVNTLQHEYIHYWLFHNEGLRATHMWDYASIRQLYDLNGYLGFVVDRGNAYYLQLINSQLKKEKLLKNIEV